MGISKDVETTRYENISTKTDGLRNPGYSDVSVTIGTMKKRVHMHTQNKSKVDAKKGEK